MKPTAPPSNSHRPEASEVAEPRLRLSNQPHRGALASPLLHRLRLLLPPVAVPLQAARLFAVPRFLGLDRVPAGPWPSLHVAILALAAAAGQWWLSTPQHAATLLRSAAVPIVPAATPAGRDGFLAAALDTGRRYVAIALTYLAEHAHIVWWTILVMLAACAAARLLLVADRCRTRRIWNHMLDVFLLLRGHDMPLVAARRRRHLAWHSALIVLWVALIASAVLWAPPFPPQGWRWPALLATNAARAVICTTLLAAWLLVLLLLRMRCRDSLSEAATDFGASAEADGPVLPRLTLDGLTPVPQLDPVPPLTAAGRRLDGLRSQGRRVCFATLFAMDRSEEYRYLPGGDVAGSPVVRPSVLRIPPGQEFFARRDDEKPDRETWLLPGPAAVAKDLLAVMYLAAAASGRVGKRHNSVIRDFCLAHELCLAVNEVELSTALLALAAEEWSIAPAPALAMRIRTTLEQLDSLPPVAEYLRQWHGFHPGAAMRRRLREFDPLLQSPLKSLDIEFSRLGHLLVEAIVYADRRVEAGESMLLGELGLLGDYESRVDAVEGSTP